MQLYAYKRNLTKLVCKWYKCTNSYRLRTQTIYEGYKFQNIMKEIDLDYNSRPWRPKNFSFYINKIFYLMTMHDYNISYKFTKYGFGFSSILNIVTH